MTIALWSSDAWRQEALAWLDEHLAGDGTRRVGEVTQPHLRPWATVLRAPTTRGVVWLKAAGPETAFEVELYGLLERVVPERVLVPIARDPGRGWIVLPDGGARLGERLDEVDLVEAMAVAVGRYVGRHGTAGDRETLRRAEAMAGRVGEWCQRLAGAAVGASLDHNDLHFWNVFVDTGAAGTVGRVRFYDWGDSVVAHPFASMLLGLGMIGLQLEVAADDPAVTRPRDAYLEVFGDLASHAELVEELELACRVGKVGRALRWDRAVRLQGAEAGEFADAPLRALESLLSDSAIVAV
jgi:hypothetical protein